ncbi:hypothetical protein DUNSADRAFT_4951 [Dunaliella salina]|uniref:Uncharacterized protein n=1 Tax=Dunaliella salina TaxID=3046 RepID=A0ABQ7GQX8_DUNSA|nr:hypothetical protein DUNSADRAFT_4951 [Dunaliella salina]|eukprot:KAF5837026.1 hypothetical protein DUNSADRAFT_4951 [Dunaliella salina]
MSVHLMLTVDECWSHAECQQEPSTAKCHERAPNADFDQSQWLSIVLVAHPMLTVEECKGPSIVLVVHPMLTVVQSRWLSVIMHVHLMQGVELTTANCHECSSHADCRPGLTADLHGCPPIADSTRESMPVDFHERSSHADCGQEAVRRVGDFSELMLALYRTKCSHGTPTPFVLLQKPAPEPPKPKAPKPKELPSKAYDHTELMAARRRALLDCVHHARTFHKHAWAQTAIELTAEHCWQNKSRFCSQLHEEVDELWRWVRYARAMRKRGPSAKEINRDSTSFERASATWSRMDVPTKGKVGAQGDTKSVQWLG